ncbi:MAG: outer membrane lipoprotein-sorting protein [Candidatus Aminicenantia bacterium]
MKRLLLIMFLVPFVMAQDAQEIIKKMEQVMRGKSSVGEMEMTVVKKEWTRKLRLKYWEKGKEKSVVVILAPAKERGIATLKIGNKVWNYLPSIERTIKLPPSMMSQSWMGSHFTNDDLVRESSLERDYDAKLIKQDNEKYYLELIPKPEAMVVWGKIEAEIDKKTYLPLRAYYYDEKGEKIRSLVYSDIKKVDNRYFPFLWTLYPEKKPGEKTEIKVISIKFNVPIQEKIFTIRFLKELSK